MNAKHTPGPWVVQYGNEMPELEVVSQDGWGVSLCAAGLSGAETEANARLIAAAPELLKFLMDAREALFAGNIEEVEGILAGDWCSTVIEGVTSLQEAL